MKESKLIGKIKFWTGQVLADNEVFQRIRAVEAFESRIKRLEQFHCEHEFSNHNKGCVKSVFCFKCGVLHPDWEWWGGMALPDREDGIWVGSKCYVPKKGKKK